MTTQKISITLNVLTPCVHRLLEASGISTVRVLQSINAHLGKMACVKQGESSLGVGKIVGKGLVFQQTENLGTAKFETTADVVGEFKTWQDVQGKLEKQFGEFDLKSVPVRFQAWLAKHGSTPAAIAQKDVAKSIVQSAAKADAKKAIAETREMVSRNGSVGLQPANTPK